MSVQKCRSAKGLGGHDRGTHKGHPNKNESSHSKTGCRVATRAARGLHVVPSQCTKDNHHNILLCMRIPFGERVCVCVWFVFAEPQGNLSEAHVAKEIASGEFSQGRHFYPGGWGRLVRGIQMYSTHGRASLSPLKLPLKMPPKCIPSHADAMTNRKPHFGRVWFLPRNQLGQLCELKWLASL